MIYFIIILFYILSVASSLSTYIDIKFDRFNNILLYTEDKIIIESLKTMKWYNIIIIFTPIVNNIYVLYNIFK